MRGSSHADDDGIATADTGRSRKRGSFATKTNGIKLTSSFAPEFPDERNTSGGTGQAAILKRKKLPEGGRLINFEWGERRKELKSQVKDILFAIPQHPDNG